MVVPVPWFPLLLFIQLNSFQGSLEETTCWRLKYINLMGGFIHITTSHCSVKYSYLKKKTLKAKKEYEERKKLL